MESEPKSLWSKITHSIWNRVFAGLLLLIPIGVTVLFLRLLFQITAGFLGPLIKPFAGKTPDWVLGMVSVAALLFLLYLAGLITTHVIGRRLIALGEAILVRIPLGGTIYSAAKQVVQTFSQSSTNTVKRIVLLEFPRPEIWALGFVTGVIHDDADNVFYKILIPNSPNPATGFLQLVPCESVKETDLTIEEAIKMIVSAGVISPPRLEGSPLYQTSMEQDLLRHADPGEI